MEEIKCSDLPGEAESEITGGARRERTVRLLCQSVSRSEMLFDAQ